MTAVARALSCFGFRVIVPCISDIEQLIIHPATINKFAALIEAVAAHSQLNANQRQLGIFSASYSGGVALLAASYPQISTSIKAMCLIGTFADFRNVSDLFWTRKKSTNMRASFYCEICFLRVRTKIQK